MILATPDLKTIYKVVVARRKNNADEVQQDERCIRNAEVGSSSLPIGSTLNEGEPT